MTWISVDVESDGPYPGFGIPPMAKDTWGYSMVAIGACAVKDAADTSKGFLGYLKPISERWDPEALSISGFTREEVLEFPDPRTTMAAFAGWLKENAEPPYIFVADNNGYDFAFTNWYFHQFLGHNPFGFSSKNLNNLFQGIVGDTFKSFKYLRKTKHDHNPLNDARANAEALLSMVNRGIEVEAEYGTVKVLRKLKIKL